MMLEIATVVLVAIAICAVRAVLGPTAPDRIVAFDGITSLMIAILVILGIYYRASIYLDVALVYAFLAFLGTLAISKYLEGRGVET